MTIVRLQFRALGCLARLLVFTFIFSLGLPAVADALFQEDKEEQLSGEFIAVSESPMTWATAKAWCGQRSGRLPLINGASALSWDEVINSKKIVVDGIGTVIDGFRPDMNEEEFRKRALPWSNTGLPGDRYWTGTELAGFPGYSWAVGNRDGYARVLDALQSYLRRAFCVP